MTLQVLADPVVLLFWILPSLSVVGLFAYNGSLRELLIEFLSAVIDVNVNASLKFEGKLLTLIFSLS